MILARYLRRARPQHLAFVHNFSTSISKEHDEIPVLRTSHVTSLLLSAAVKGAAAETTTTMNDHDTVWMESYHHELSTQVINARVRPSVLTLLEPVSLGLGQFAAAIGFQDDFVSLTTDVSKYVANDGLRESQDLTSTTRVQSLKETLKSHRDMCDERQSTENDHLNAASTGIAQLLVNVSRRV